jgi:hypothetical protein
MSGRQKYLAQFPERLICKLDMSPLHSSVLIRSMHDFARLIAASEKCPSIAFSFKPLDPTVLVNHPPMPKCAKGIIGRAIHSILVSHDGAQGI